jgi:hypothetical protein
MTRQRPPRTIIRRHERPFGGPSGRIEVLWKKDVSLPNTVNGLSREVEGWSRRRGGRSGYIRRAFGQNLGHGFGGKSRRNEGWSQVGVNS